MPQSIYRTSNKLAKWMKSLAPSEILYPFSYVYDNVNVMLPLRILIAQWDVHLIPSRLVNGFISEFIRRPLMAKFASFLMTDFW